MNILYVVSQISNEKKKTKFSSAQSLSCVWLFVTPRTAACQASLSIANSWSLFKLMSIKWVTPSSHLILCRPLLLLPPIPPSIKVFSNESTLHMRWPDYWSFSFSIILSKEIPGLISFRMDWLDLLAVQINALGQVNVKIWWSDIAVKKAFNVHCYFFMINRINMWLFYDKKNHFC